MNADEIILQLFGKDEDLTALQVMLRSFCMFFFAVFIFRLGGVRIFGRKSAFDNVVAVMLGAILSRGIVGSTPFMHAVLAAAVLAIIHRLVGWLSIKSKLIGSLSKGDPVIIYENGTLYNDRMTQCSISHNDLKESLRLETGQEKLDDIDTIYLERSGRMSFIKKGAR